MKRLARKYLPAGMQSLLRRGYYRFPLLRRLYYLPQDLAVLLRPGRDGLQPPRSLMTVGDGDFAAIGREFLQYFIELGHLRPAEKVLEVGCGVGRMAIPLTTYLDDTGSYEGFDIAPAEVAWCRKNITPRFPRFNFQHVDVLNQQTNPGGRLAAASFRLPFAGEQFDFVFLTSVFTHMLIQDIENYLREISRVLRPGGRLLTTYFLLDGETRGRLEKMNSRFRHPFGSSLAIDPKLPEASIAHEEATIRTMYHEAGLVIREPVRYGSWSGRGHFLSSQDIVLADKNGSRQR
ncbi:MAG: class I SAM-dependent methyltransferase [Acidobacteria bacterium]|jgi:ubiquinone/menaquinone biosynthesis C-methylase UbiE|nr:class I SAM-dependent methyltransferase [Acidobacteriota bacterium]